MDIEEFVKVVESLHLESKFSGRQKSEYLKSLAKAKLGFIRAIIFIATCTAVSETLDEAIKEHAIDILKRVSLSDNNNQSNVAKYELMKINLKLNRYKEAKLLADTLKENDFFPVYFLMAGVHHHIQHQDFYNLGKASEYYKLAIDKGHIPSQVAYAKIQMLNGNLLQKVKGFFLFLSTSTKLFKSFSEIKSKEYILSIFPLDYSSDFLKQKI